MAKRTDDSGGTSFLTNTPNADNSWLYKQKSPAQPNYSVLAEYYARQAAAKLRAGGTYRPGNQGIYYNVTQPGQVSPNIPVAPQNQQIQAQRPPNPGLGSQIANTITGAGKWLSSNIAGAGWNAGRVGGNALQQGYAQVMANNNQSYNYTPIIGRNPYKQFDFNNWYRNVVNPNPTNATTYGTQTNYGPYWSQYATPQQGGPYAAPNKVAPWISNPKLGPSMIYKGNKVPIGMQRYEEIASGRASPEMLLYGSANRWTEHLPQPPTGDDGTGSGGGGGGYYTGYPSYSGGGGGGGYGSYTPQPSRWWTDNAIWRI